MFRETWLFLVQIDRLDGEIDGGMFLEVQEKFQHGVGILATGQTDHDQVAIFDHAVIADRPPDFSSQVLLKAIESEIALFAGHAYRPVLWK